ncbi:hypothetical protein [Campylobacter fetus]|uniref:hypothetical protein n=1 Tax=Campylobacter fetus TaxID=196 RepID=UPI0013015DAC|nr:hypothetical protein [Campylobacter fetus]
MDQVTEALVTFIGLIFVFSISFIIYYGARLLSHILDTLGLSFHRNLWNRYKKLF